MMTKKDKLPVNLSKEARVLRKNLIDEYEINDSGGLAILNTAMEAFDRLKGAQEIIKRDGITFKDRWGQIKNHPLLTIERDARSQFLQGLKALNLDIEPLRDRPGRPGGS